MVAGGFISEEEIDKLITVCDTPEEVVNHHNGYENTVMVHIRHLREKIEDDPANPRFIKTVKSKGYYFDTKG